MIAVILWLICAAMFLPMVFVIMNSFKTFGQVVMEPLALPESWNLDNFKEVMNTGHYAKIFGNTIDHPFRQSAHGHGLVLRGYGHGKGAPG